MTVFVLFGGCCCCCLMQIFFIAHDTKFKSKRIRKRKRKKEKEKPNARSTYDYTVYFVYPTLPSLLVTALRLYLKLVIILTLYTTKFSFYGCVYSYSTCDANIRHSFINTRRRRNDDAAVRWLLNKIQREG